MQLSSAPVQIQLPFANGDGSKTNPIPVPSQISITPGAASFTDGFPPLCATPVTSGGIPPSKSDMDGILFMLSSIDLWNSAGAGFPYNGTYSTAIGGYPKGSRVLRATGYGYWLSIVDNNVTDPDTGGAGWIPDQAVSSVYAAGQQTVAPAGKVIFDTVQFDSLGQWNSGAHRFVVKWPGIYRVSGAVYLPSANAQNYATQIYQNGSIAKTCLEFPQVSNVDLRLSFGAMVQCAIGDYLEVFLYAQSTSNLVGYTTSNESAVFAELEYLGNG